MNTEHRARYVSILTKSYVTGVVAANVAFSPIYGWYAVFAILGSFVFSLPVFAVLLLLYALNFELVNRRCVLFSFIASAVALTIHCVVFIGVDGMRGALRFEEPHVYHLGLPLLIVFLSSVLFVTLASAEQTQAASD
ncbi:hypothetical protein CU102_17965 [Phyllobacterium brassicacearum]|uniref:Uncharacterized protein n=1 Tax=Phyllobacterium brassicacearum TaxID=314235 RepID=A0A2P7BJU6_9HYPH|nr:hypothetical protein CU102_17965 [Phyllobacterium brassicacearum]TDQ32011.1 hypothetical protein DEV91_106108 [Phyllobacterium brassicacearum]